MANKIYEALIDETGRIRLMESVTCTGLTRALVIVLEGEQPSDDFTSSRTVSDSASRATESSDSALSTTPSWTSRYRPLRALGQGGMGKVLLAERISDRALVCLKFPREGVNPRVFDQECRALLRVRHPSIVSLLDFSAAETPPWLATEYAAGPTLSAYLREHGSLPLKTAIDILRRVLEGLAYAHSQQVIHRDLKPGNLIVDDQQRDVGARILDFGIAIVDSFDQDGNPTAQGAIQAGTFLYMAPEQLRSDLLGPPCDMYATGLIAWEMLMGRPAFQSADLVRLLIEKLALTGGCKLNEPPMQVPSSLCELIEACTRPEPNNRPTAAQALAVLNRLAD
jgi:serine/threonine protein kinase